MLSIAKQSLALDIVFSLKKVVSGELCQDSYWTVDIEPLASIGPRRPDNIHFISGSCSAVTGRAIGYLIHTLAHSEYKSHLDESDLDACLALVKSIRDMTTD